MSNKKQTALQELISEFEELKKTKLYQTSFKAIDDCILLAYHKLAMEKEQMIEFGFDTYCFISGIMKVPFEQISENKLNSEHNYNETYENSKD